MNRAPTLQLDGLGRPLIWLLIRRQFGIGGGIGGCSERQQMGCRDIVVE
jgi:hypothetical protein